MPTVIANAFRLLLMVAFCLGSMPVIADASCTGPATASACGCCPAAEAGCCAASENEAPAPAAPMHENQAQQQVRDALSPFAPVVVILPSADALIVSFPQPVVVAAMAGHTRQSVLCVRTV